MPIRRVKLTPSILKLATSPGWASRSGRKPPGWMAFTWT